MFAVDRLLLVAAVLVIVGIISSKFSARLGLPVLVLFVGIGMLAGSDGLGGIAFTNYQVAHGVGTIALAIILFDGGLRTGAVVVPARAGPRSVACDRRRIHHGRHHGRSCRVAARRGATRRLPARQHHQLDRCCRGVQRSAIERPAHPQTARSRARGRERLE